MEANHFDLIVIGSGSAGSAAWSQARKLGKSVAVFESDTLGGECATYACMPTKALLHCAEVFNTAKGASRFGVKLGEVSFDYAAVKAWKDTVVSETGAALGEKPFVDAGVQLVREAARFTGPNEIEAGGRRYSAENVLIATGSRQRLADVPGLKETGYLTFREAIDLTELPASVFVLGGGPVGCEFSHLFSSFGAKVYIADHNPRLLAHEDPQAGDLLSAIFKQRGIEVLTGAKVLEVGAEAGKKRVVVEQNGATNTLIVDEVLVATGKAPNLDLNLEAAGVRYNERGIEVDETLRTTNPRIFAAGDVAGPYQFTHAASYQGVLASHNMFNPDQALKVDYGAMPRCVFTAPEVASVGLTEQQAQERGVAIKVGRAEIFDNDRGLTTDQREGFVKVFADRDRRIVGGVIVAPRAGEMLHELGMAIALGATVDKVAGLIHAVPTFSEAVGAACKAIE